MLLNDCTKHNPNLKTEYIPLSLFQQGQDLPLFTSSCDIARIPRPEPVEPKSANGQLSLFGEVAQ